MPRHKLSFIIIGNHHADFTPYSVLIRLFENLVKRKIPCAFKVEGPSDETIEDAIESTQRGLRQTHAIKKMIPELKQLYTKDQNSGHTYLTQSVGPSVEAMMKAKFMPTLPVEMQNSFILNSLVADFFRENAYLEELKLLQKLKELKVPFAGIEADRKIYNQYMQTSNNDYGAYFNKELMRIGYMVEHILRDSLDRFSEGGIVFIFTGRIHAHRLAANLLHHVKTHHLDSTKFDFYAFNLCSSYIEEWNTELADTTKYLTQLDSPEIKEIYKTLLCPTITCQQSTIFNFLELEDLVNQLIQTFEVMSAPSSSIFSPLAPHDQLVVDIKAYLKQYPKIPVSLLTHVETHRNYSLALRNACAWGKSDLVKIIINYSHTLPIDFNDTSATTGKTPLMWFKASSATEAEKNEIVSLLEEKMAVKKVGNLTQICS